MASSKPKCYDDEFLDSYDDECSSIETDPKWGRELDFEGNPFTLLRLICGLIVNILLLMLIFLTLILRIKIGLTNLAHFQVCLCSCGCVLTGDDFSF